MVLNIILAAICILIVFFVWVAIFDTNRFEISRYSYEDNRIKKAFKAVVLSDLHNKVYGKDNESLIKAIGEEKPDMILIAGDMVNGHPNEKLDSAINLLKKLSEKYPIYYGNGNHEMRMNIYKEDYGDKYDEYVNLLKAMGVHHLVNSSEYLDEYGINIIGSEISKEHYKRFGITPMDEGELERDLGVLNKDAYNILIAHNPDYFDAYVSYNPSLVLSGHVHGGIVRIPFINKGVLSPNVRFFPKYYGGEYEKNGTTMLVSRGLGAHTIPFRLFNPGDLVTISFSPCGSDLKKI